VRLHD